MTFTIYLISIFKNKLHNSMTYTKLILIAFCLLLTLNLSAQSSKLIGKPAPDIHFTDVLNDRQTSYKLSDFKGKVVIIDFWATWCDSMYGWIASFRKLAEKIS
jgi:thiol:disulfide interchange protein